MKLNILLFFVSASIILFSCKNDKQTTNKDNLESNTTNSLKDVSELTYMDIYKLLYTTNNGGFDAHGDLYGQEAITSIKTEEELSNCGKAVYLVNTSNKTIELAVKATFNLTGNPHKEMVRAYRIEPAQKISIGNTKLCYANKEYLIGKQIISAGFQIANQ